MTVQTQEKNLEEDIESFLCSPAGGFLRCDDRHSLLYVEDGTYQMVAGGYMEHRDRALDAATLVNFVQTTQPRLGSASSACAILIPRRSSPRSSTTPSTA